MKWVILFDDRLPLRPICLSEASLKSDLIEHPSTISISRQESEKVGSSEEEASASFTSAPSEERRSFRFSEIRERKSSTRLARVLALTFVGGFSLRMQVFEHLPSTREQANSGSLRNLHPNYEAVCVQLWDRGLFVQRIHLWSPKAIIKIKYDHLGEHHVCELHTQF